MKTLRQLVRRWVWCLAAAAGVASIGDLGGAIHAQDEPPPTLSGSVESDGSEPPIGFYPDPDRPLYVEVPTLYWVSPGSIEYQYRGRGNALAKTSSSFEGTTAKHEQPALYAVSNILTGKRLLHGNPAGTWVASPYFNADKNLTCPTPACSPRLDNVKLYAKLGNVIGDVKLEDGTKIPFPLAVTATPLYVPPHPNAAQAFRSKAVVTGLGGTYSFSATHLIAEPTTEQTCFTPGTNYYCEPIPFDLKNNWGLRVLGDGGAQSRDPMTYSNSKGTFPWVISISSKRRQPVDVRGSEAAVVRFRLPLEEYFETLWEQRENRARRGDSSEDDPLCEGADGGIAPYPVSLFTGNVLIDQTDVTLPGVRHDLDFTRSYNSHSGPAGTMGKGWNHAFEKRIEALSSQILRLWGADGAPMYFTDPDEDGMFGVYGSPNGSSTITRAGDGFTRSFRDGSSESYRGDGRLVSRSDRTGRTTNLTLNSIGQVTQIRSPEGRILKLAYSGDQLLRTLTGPNGLIAEYSYTFSSAPYAARLTTVRYPDGRGYRFTYNDQNQLLTVADLAGVVLDRHGYSGQKAAWSELNGGRERRTYSYEADRTVVTNAAGGVSTFEWTQTMAGKFITKVTGCDFCGTVSGTQTWDRDGEGRVTRYVDADNNVTIYEYEGRNLVRVTNALGRITTLGGHDPFGRPATISVPGWGTTTLTYASEGVQAVRLPGGQTTTLTYRNNGIETIRSATGLTTTLTRNDRGEVLSATDPRGRTRSYTYEAMGRLTTSTEPDGLTTTFVQDAAGRLLEVVRPDGNKVRLRYDLSGRLISVTDEAGHTTSYAYDIYGRPESTVDAVGSVTRLTYDIMSNVTSLTDGRGQTTTFEYDAIGQLLRKIDPMGGRESYEYYPSGRLRTRTDRRGIVTTYVYDGLGRLKSQTFSDATPALTIDYDDDVRTVSMANGTDTLTWAFDPSGRRLSETSALNASTVSYTYDHDGVRESLSLDGTALARYRYLSGYLDAIEFSSRELRFGYDDLGRRTRLTYPNGVETTYQYHRTSRFLEAVRTQLEGTSIATSVYTHDTVGNRTSKATGDWTEAYVYDAASRLTRVTRTGASTSAMSFEFDAVGNRTRDETNGLTRAFAYDARNRLQGTLPGSLLTVAGSTTEPATVTVNGTATRALPGNAFATEAPTAGDPLTLSIQATDASAYSGPS